MKTQHPLGRFAEFSAALFWLVLALHNALNATHPLQWLVIAQFGLTAVRMVWRHSPNAATPWRWQALAWASALLPLVLQSQPEPSSFVTTAFVLQIIGLSLAVYALFTLGRAFGIAPADRGLVQHGPYRWLRHPAYAGELLALWGFGLVFPTLFNLSLLGLITLTLIVRVRAEEAVIAGYATYAAQVRWRLMPGVW
jgi:protein-S-isoprenylcysteine O-methyltransferase Ste14